MADTTCPGAGVIVASKGSTIPRCAGVRELIAAGEPLAVVATAPRAGATHDAYDAIEDMARAAGRGTVMVLPKVRVADETDRTWRATLHPHTVVAVENADAITTLCATGVVAVCGTDEVLCTNSHGRAVGTVDPGSLLRALSDAVGGPANVCSESCPAFRPDQT